MIHSLQRADVVAVEDDFALELVPVLLDVVVLDHNDYHIHLGEELVEVEDLVLDNLLLGEEGVEGLQRTGEVALLDVEHLEGRALTDVIDVLLVGEAVEADAAVVGDAVLLHNLVDALEDEDGLVVVGLHRLVDDFGQLGIVAHEEPGIDADAVAAYAGTGLEDVHTGVHIADADDLIDIHIVVTADAAEFVGKGDVDGTVGVLDDLGHLGSADVGDDDLALAEGGVVTLDLLANLLGVGSDGAVVVQQLIDHIAGDDALGGVDEVDVFTDLEAIGLDNRTDELIDGAGADGGFDDDGGSLGADLHHLLDGSDDIAGVHLLGELVVGGRDGDDVHIRLLILGGELDARLDGCGEELVETIFLEGRFTGIQGSHQFLVVVCADDFHAVGCHHKGGRKTNVAEANYVYHLLYYLFLFYFISIYLLAVESADDAAAGLAVAVGVDGLGHTLVGLRVVEEGADFADDEVVVGAHEVDGAALEGFGTLGGVAHHEDGLAQAGGLFLDAAAVGEDDGGFLHQIDELEVLQRLDEEEVAVLGEVFAEHLVDGLAHVGVEVHRIDEVYVGVFLAEVFHCRDHRDEAFAEVLATVAGDEDELASVVKTGDVVACGLEHIDLLIGQGLVALELLDHHMEGIDDSVAGDEDLALRLLFEEVLLAEGRGGEVVGGDAAGDLAVHLLGPGAVDVVGAEAGLHVAHGNLLVERSEGSGGGGGGVAVDQHHIGLALLEHVAHTGEHAGGDVVQVLSLLHNVEVEVGLHLEDAQHLVQHLAVLSRHAHNRLKLLRIFLELLHQRAHLNRLRPRSKHKHYFFHWFIYRYCLFRFSTFQLS